MSVGRRDLRVVLAATLAVAATAASAGSASSQTPAAGRRPGATPVRIAYTSGIFRDISLSDARASIKVWSETAARERNIPAYAEIEVVPDAETLAEGVRTGQVDFGGSTMHEFLQIEPGLKLDPILTIRRGDSFTVEYLLLVKLDSGIRSVADLKGAEIRLFDNPRSSLALPWFELLLAKRGIESASGFVGAVVPATKLSSVVLPVFFGQATACLVTRDGFLTMVELNPQLEVELSVLAESPAVVPMVSFFREDFQPAFRDDLIRAICDLHATASGRQILNLMQSDGVTRLQPSDLDATRELLRRWRDRNAGTSSRSAAQGRRTTWAEAEPR